MGHHYSFPLVKFQSKAASFFSKVVAPEKNHFIKKPHSDRRRLSFLLVQKLLLEYSHAFHVYDLSVDNEIIDVHTRFHIFPIDIYSGFSTFNHFDIVQ